MERLRAESDDGGTRRRFDGLVPFLTGENEGGYREVAAALDMSESAARVAVHRMRRRFGTIVREEVARTVGEQGDVEDELRQLFAALDSGS
jgi:RNA polymerase sigma-70 factor (ECF subfamily)